MVTLDGREPVTGCQARARASSSTFANGVPRPIRCRRDREAHGFETAAQTPRRSRYANRRRACAAADRGRRSAARTARNPAPAAASASRTDKRPPVGSAARTRVQQIVLNAGPGGSGRHREASRHRSAGRLRFAMSASTIVAASPSARRAVRAAGPAISMPAARRAGASALTRGSTRTRGRARIPDRRSAARRPAPGREARGRRGRRGAFRASSRARGARRRRSAPPPPRPRSSNGVVRTRGGSTASSISGMARKPAASIASSTGEAPDGRPVRAGRPWLAPS